MIYIVLPAYNEGLNVQRLLQDITDTLKELLPASKVRLVVVNDGSQDDTAQVVQACRDKIQADIELIEHPENRGLAEALKTGLTYCCDVSDDRDIILTMDCDNSHTPGLIPRLARRIFEGYDVVIASRYQPGARVVGLSFHRIVLSYGASMMMRLLFPIKGVRDYTCGFRAYRAGLLKTVFRENENFISEKGFAVMLDILLKLRQYDPHLAMAEVPILLRYDRKLGASKMNVPKTIRQTLRLVAVRVAEKLL